MQRDQLRPLIEEMYSAAHPLTSALCKAISEVWSRTEVKHKHLRSAIELGRTIGQLAEKMAAAFAAELEHRPETP